MKIFEECEDCQGKKALRYEGSLAGYPGHDLCGVVLEKNPGRVWCGAWNCCWDSPKPDKIPLGKVPVL